MYNYCVKVKHYMSFFQDWVVRQISSLDLSDELWIGLYKSNNVYDWDDGTHPNTSNL